MQIMERISNHQRLLRRAEACERLGIGLSTYKRLVNAGELQEIAIGRARRLPEIEVDRYIKVHLDNRRSAAA